MLGLRGGGLWGLRLWLLRVRLFGRIEERVAWGVDEVRWVGVLVWRIVIGNRCS